LIGGLVSETCGARARGGHSFTDYHKPTDMRSWAAKGDLFDEMMGPV
jgi:hypothetical protein